MIFANVHSAKEFSKCIHHFFFLFPKFSLKHGLLCLYYTKMCEENVYVGVNECSCFCYGKYDQI